MKKPNNIVRIPCSLGDKSFFKYWFKILKIFHRLTDREIDVVTSLLKHRYELSKVIKDDELLEKIAMSEDIKRSVREECGMALPHFQVIMGKLRNNKVIVNNRINPKFIPHITEGDDTFQLLFLFDLKDEASGDNK